MILLIMAAIIAELRNICYSSAFYKSRPSAFAIDCNLVNNFMCFARLLCGGRRNGRSHSGSLWVFGSFGPKPKEQIKKLVSEYF
jgi:hypothetical protein